MPTKSKASIKELLPHLRQVRRNSKGWTARCPAHEDRKPSLSIAEQGGKILLYCHAGCSVEAVCAALGIKMHDLFTDATAQLLGGRRNMTPAARLKLESAQIERRRRWEREAEHREQERRERIAARDELHRLERDYSQAGLRLSELLRGKPERYRGEKELSWWALANLLPRVRVAEAHYRRLAGLEDHTDAF